jgi:hypothetical protein
MFSRRRSLCTAMALGTILATFACAPAPEDNGNGDEGGTGDNTGGAGGKKTGGSGGKTGAGGTIANNGGTSGGSGGISGGSGGTSGGDGGTSGGDGGTTGSGGTSGGDGGTSGGDGGTTGSGGTSGGTGGTSGGTGGTSGGAVTFTELYDAIFSQGPSNPKSCWGANCHNPGVKDKVDMSSKAKAYMTLSAKVKAGMPGTSALVTRLESKDVKMRMPLNKPALDSTLIDKVKSWITAGATNN